MIFLITNIFLVPFVINIGMSTNYCYALSASPNPTNFRYIGETTNLKLRLYRHIYTAKTSKKRWPVVNWITKHLTQGEHILITPICICERDTYEIDLIAKGRLLGWNLLNIQDGSNTSGGMKNKNHSSDAKEKMSMSRKGKQKSAMHRNNISTALIGRTFSDEHLSNLSKSAKTKPTVSCEHCGMTTTKSNYTKWHGIKCKNRQE